MMARVCVRKDLGESLRAAVGEDAEDAQGRREREAEEVGKFSWRSRADGGATNTTRCGP